MRRKYVVRRKEGGEDKEICAQINAVGKSESKRTLGSKSGNKGKMIGRTVKEREEFVSVKEETQIGKIREQ